MDPNSPLAHSKHIFRVGFLFVVGVVVLIIARAIFTPATWGQYGPYRGASLLDYQALPVRHGGPESCAPCHEDAYAVHQGGSHAGVSCEVCHAPVAGHAANGSWIAGMPVRKTVDLCLLCHEEMVARPRTFPQVRPRQHVADGGATWGDAVCFECHDPHSPF